MKNLFIVGNGFDIDHKIHSEYKNFREYLDRLCNDDFYGVPEVIIYPDGSEHFNEAENTQFIKRVLDEIEGEEWSFLEESLGKLDFSEFFYEVNCDFKQVYTNEYIARNIRDSFSEISDYFTEWIQSLDLGVKPKRDFIKLISDEDIFLSFNYTTTLEEVYNIQDEKILHIHGCALDGTELAFGHGENRYNELLDCFEDDSDYTSNFYGGEDYIYELSNALKKDTKEILQNNIETFKNMSDVNNIFSYGFSYGTVDLIYIKEIIKRVNGNENVVWYLNDYDDDEVKEYSNILKEMGFKGVIKTFSIKE